MNKGYRLGFVAGSDTHAGNPGYAHWVFSEHVNSYRGGLTCAITDELSLPSIFSALQKRKVYATTGERIILDFTLNNAQMGEEIPYKENKRRTLELKSMVQIKLTGLILFLWEMWFFHIKEKEPMLSFNGLIIAT